LGEGGRQHRARRYSNADSGEDDRVPRLMSATRIGASRSRGSLEGDRSEATLAGQLPDDSSFRREGPFNTIR
jgi:hypothetical protein